MNKSKLQELCHQYKWGLPKYSCMKGGPDHDSQFMASVSVNGRTFDTPIICKSSKEAQNEAAKLAILHFTSVLSTLFDCTTKLIAGGPEIEHTFVSPEIYSNTSGVKLGSSIPSTEPNAGLSQIEKECQSSEINANVFNLEDGLIYQYKKKLQSYAQRRNLDPPVYSSIREGPPHALCFKATVTVDGHCFESPGYFKTLKESEHSAAKVALMSLSLDVLQENDTRFYKNYLQELTQNEGFTLPTYKTFRAGTPHEPTFFSSVEVEGETFNGKEGSSKKQAEINAAEVAYSVLMKRRTSRSGNLTPPGSPEDEVLEFNPSMDSLTLVDPQQSLKDGGPLVSSSTVIHEKQTKESKDEVEAENIVFNTEVGPQKPIPSPAIPYRDKMTRNGNSSSSLKSLPSSPKEGRSCTAAVTPHDLSADLTADFNKRKTNGTRSYLLGNKVRVYTCIPDVAFPKGTVLLPISDDKWVAVSLEFPNEKR